MDIVNVLKKFNEGIDVTVYAVEGAYLDFAYDNEKLVAVVKVITAIALTALAFHVAPTMAAIGLCMGLTIGGLIATARYMKPQMMHEAGGDFSLWYKNECPGLIKIAATIVGVTASILAPMTFASSAMAMVGSIGVVEVVDYVTDDSFSISFRGHTFSTRNL